jgi:hypothetical protein
MNPSSQHVIWAAGDHHVPGDFHQERARWHRATLQRHVLQGPTIVIVESVWVTLELDLTFSTEFVN